MSLASQVSALATAVGSTVKALTSRVTTLEARAPIVILTQSAYDALSPPDSNTLYVIVG